MSIDFEHKEFICKKCGGVLSKKDRSVGRWIAQKSGAEWSGYHISLLMAPWVTAKEIIDKFNDPKQTEDYFYNKVLGLPYVGSGNVATEEMILGLVTNEKNLYNGRLVIGVDTGKKLHYVVGNQQGLVEYGTKEDYEPDPRLGITLENSIEYYLKKFSNSVMVIDQGGDIIGSRKLAKRYPGRVFLCHYSVDRKTMQLIRWGEKDESGNVVVDRNRMIQLVIDEFRQKRLSLFNGTKSDWWNYWLHWSHIYRVKEEDELGVDRYAWRRSDRDDWVHATVYWRVGIDKFGGVGQVIMSGTELDPNSYLLNPDSTVSFNPDKMFGNKDDSDFWWAEEDDDDWRNR